MTHVLFVCVRNSGKSPMAEGLLRHLLVENRTTDITVGSAGTQPGADLNAASVEALVEIGIDIGGARPTPLTVELQQQSDLVVVLGTEARVDRVPGPRYETWETDEPSRRGIEGDERMRLIRDDIARRVEGLHMRLGQG